MDATSPEGGRMLDPRVRALWWIEGSLWAAVVTASALLADFLFLPRFLPPEEPSGWLPAAVALLSLGMAALLPPLRYRRWRYELREHDIWIRRGVVWVGISVIPYSRLQFVDTEHGPLERLLGLASLVVYTAAPGTSGRIPGLAAETAEELRERVARIDAVPIREPA